MFVRSRSACRRCTIKHLAQAAVLALEYCKGHDEHAFLIIGHLAEAEDEIIGMSWTMAEDIRRLRKSFEDHVYENSDVDLSDLYGIATGLMQAARGELI